jgi:hypothetical protein
MILSSKKMTPSKKLAEIITVPYNIPQYLKIYSSTLANCRHNGLLKCHMCDIQHGHRGQQMVVSSGYFTGSKLRTQLRRINVLAGQPVSQSGFRNRLFKPMLNETEVACGRFLVGVCLRSSYHICPTNLLKS